MHKPCFSKMFRAVLFLRVMIHRLSIPWVSKLNIHILELYGLYGINLCKAIQGLLHKSQDRSMIEEFVALRKVKTYAKVFSLGRLSKLDHSPINPTMHQSRAPVSRIAHKSDTGSARSMKKKQKTKQKQRNSKNTELHVPCCTRNNKKSRKSECCSAAKKKNHSTFFCPCHGSSFSFLSWVRHSLPCSHHRLLYPCYQGTLFEVPCCHGQRLQYRCSHHILYHCPSPRLMYRLKQSN